MKIIQAKNREMGESIKLASKLKKWFTKDGIKNMEIDFKINKLITIMNQNKIIGFLCYSTENGLIKILWMAIRKEHQNKGIGKKLISRIEDKARILGLRGIEVKTLTDKDKYRPYQLTREFYYKNGFKKIGYEIARVKGWDNQIIMEKILK